MGNYYSGNGANNNNNIQSNIVSKRLHNNFLDHLEKTNFQIISNSAQKKRNKSNTKSYNHNEQFEKDAVDISSYLTNLNYSNVGGQNAAGGMTNKSMVADSAHYSHHNSIGKNYDNSFTSAGGVVNGIMPSAKGG